MIGVALANNNTLKKISLKCNAIRDEGMTSILSTLETNSTITTIELSNQDCATRQRFFSTLYIYSNIFVFVYVVMQRRNVAVTFL